MPAELEQEQAGSGFGARRAAGGITSCKEAGLGRKVMVGGASKKREKFGAGREKLWKV